MIQATVYKASEAFRELFQSVDCDKKSWDQNSSAGAWKQRVPGVRFFFMEAGKTWERPFHQNPFLSSDLSSCSPLTTAKGSSGPLPFLPANFQEPLPH